MGQVLFASAVSPPLLPNQIAWILLRFVFQSLKKKVSVLIFHEVPSVVSDDDEETDEWYEFPADSDDASYDHHRVLLITYESETVSEDQESEFMLEDIDKVSPNQSSSDDDSFVKDGVCHDIPVEDTEPCSPDRVLSVTFEPDIVFEDGIDKGELVKYDKHESSALVWSSRSLNFGGAENERVEEVSDEFHNAYVERMSWFDLLHHERAGLLSAISGNPEGSPFRGNLEATHFALPMISWTGVPIQKLIQSAERDFEMIYVGQLCLGWEALHYQYRKVEGLASSSVKGAFYGNVAGKFQKFQIFLERFTENDKGEGRRVWNYVQNRSSFKSLLQVPEVSGYVEDGADGRKGEAMRAGELLKAIEKSINAFWFFLNSDNNTKSFWKLKNLPWTHTKVEDPRDWILLSNLNKALKKKELGMNDLQRKRRWSLTRNHPLEECQRMDLFFSMIDIKLVSRVLKMSMLSTNQLNWCLEKLNHIEFKDGKVVRANTSILFPPS
ncbi:hypothetical protein QJS10_CPB21g00627 [Acorus calamus]|uniref:Uncharacterized protein n=2 Tax=Acorus calamus TaxID=4465 RepID=A0AAV9C4J2_ACOCL|nr:hypothetical protein QJS10_CPB21g00627 [Acorus calamus]